MDIVNYTFFSKCAFWALIFSIFYFFEYFHKKKQISFEKTIFNIQLSIIFSIISIFDFLYQHLEIFKL